MDHELKQRLIGAIVVTALAAIFLPMLFDDPVENSGQQISELTLPKAPEKPVEKKLPDDFGRALTPDQEIPTDTAAADDANNATAGEDTELTPAALDNSTEEELVVTEDTPPPKSKHAVTSLDTGDMSESDSEAPAPRSKPTDSAHARVAPTTKKKPKGVETETHKTATTKPAELVEPEVIHKAKPVSEKTTSTLGRWSIQAGSFSKKENAIALLEKLQKQGFPVTLQAKGDIYRLKIGPELDKQRATDMKKKLDKQSIQSLMIAE